MKQYVVIFLLITIGIIAGVVLSKQSDTPTQHQPLVSSAAPATFARDRDPAIDHARIETMESEITKLQNRVAALESNTKLPIESSPGDLNLDITTFAPNILTNSPIPIAEGLIAAGIDAFTAEDIARKQSETQLKRLELRDAAIREGFIGSNRYREELERLRQTEVTIREEIDEESYDKYLFYTGQSNRIAVSSVMMGSAAEENGIHAGDLILRYDDLPLYNYNDLQSATIQGERYEIIDMTVLREGTTFTVSIPRGPLGVRLNSIRVNPTDS